MENQQIIASMRLALLNEGYLDAQFVQLEELQDNANPNFVEEIVTLFFRGSTMSDIEKELKKSPINFDTLDKVVHRLKGSSSGVGAAKVVAESIKLRDFCRERNVEGCKEAFEEVKKEYSTLKSKLETYFQLVRQAGPAETASRPK